MLSLTLITIGFLLATAVVMALARASTARWERDKRAAVAVRADGSARRTPADGSAPGGPLARIRAGLAALRDGVARRLPVAVLGRLVPTGVRRRTSRLRRRMLRLLPSALSGGRLRRGRRTESRSPGPPVEGDGDGVDTTRAPGPPRAATGVRADGVATTAGLRLLRRAVPRGRRRALAFLHRHGKGRDRHLPQDDRDGSPTAP